MEREEEMPSDENPFESFSRAFLSYLLNIVEDVVARGARLSPAY